MEIEIYFTKSAQANAEDYFSKAKKAKKKIEGAREAIKDMKKKLIETEKNFAEESKRRVKEVRKKEWYEKYHWFFASNGMLAIGGRDAQQNEQLNSKHFDNKDLFFHADIFGASVVILKDGINADQEIREEVAQFAACYSKAWEGGIALVDVYCAKRDQVTKSQAKGSLGTGSFLILGEKEWHKSVRLELCGFVEKKENKEVLNVVPSQAFSRLSVKEFVTITQGNLKKSDAAKKIMKKLRFDDLDYIMQQLPSGSFSVK